MKLEALAIRYDHGKLWILDQQALPLEEVWIETHSVDEMCQIIHHLKVRGAPLIGIAAIFALMQQVAQGTTIPELNISIEKLIATRPTAVNLKNYMHRILASLDAHHDLAMIFSIAQEIFLEDISLCENMALYGAQLLPTAATVMTYCNTGGLATAGIGTALGVIKSAYAQHKIQTVYACETRPLLQGGRLTAWELEKANIPHTLICDNMAASVMAQGNINAILVGADRIAANGDVANKIGTYSLAVLARYHHIPFYVVAPYTTLDPTCLNGGEIVIELRSPHEVKGALGKMEWAMKNTPVYNPSFDVTPSELISHYILDTGVYSTDSLIKLMS